ncbi:unnamed protein product [Amoebophrya sp. A120]|nr:unnamed protein product [Amoebophrya sp. A120]|eukprot:GSA120T00003145001.1
MPPAASIFETVELAPPDPILNTAAMYKADTHPQKVNLGIGAYRTEEGVPWVLPVVRKAEGELLQELGTENDKEYAPIDGLPGMKKATQNLIFGKSDPRIASTQALSGTGALRIVGEFMARFLGYKKVYYSDPTWGNHPTIFEKSGMVVEKYPYWNAEKKSIRVKEWIAHINAAEPGALYIIHPCAHNPTGMDPSLDEWKQIMEALIAKKCVSILDSAYQGYATGSLETDRKVIEMFLNHPANLEFFVCQSFAKNLGLYGERIGMVHAVCSSEERANAVLSQMKMVIRPMYSSPPIHGAQIVTKILSSEALYKQWCAELKLMADRILEVRTGLRKGLEEKGTPGTWNHITDQIGMFSFTGLSPEMCEKLIKDHHIYLLKSGRISLAGLNQANLQYVIDSIDQVVRSESTSANPKGCVPCLPGSGRSSRKSSGDGAAARM